MERTACGPDGKRYWTWERIERLVQLADMPDLIPGWAVSRWILAQALIHLDETTRTITAQALSSACRVLALPAPSPRGRIDAAMFTALTESDWVFRQSFLYDHGGLRHFLSRGGLGGALREQADGIEAWVDAPLGAYRLLDCTPRRLTWRDLGSGTEVVVLDLGGAATLTPGDHVLGRVVPSQDGALFETRPLPVEAAVAQEVAADPASWIDVLAANDSVETVLLPGDWFQLLTDVPAHVWRGLAEDHSPLLSDRYGDPDHRRDKNILTTEDLDQMAADLVLAAIDGRIDDTDAMDPWPCVAAAAAGAQVWPRVLLGLDRRHATALAALGERLTGPAAELCWRTARLLRDSA